MLLPFQVIEVKVCLVGAGNNVAGIPCMPFYDSMVPATMVFFFVPGLGNCSKNAQEHEQATYPLHNLWMQNNWIYRGI